MRVSVVIPLFNKAPFIRRTLESVLRQSYTDYEVIVVDDGSRDEGPEIVRGMADGRIRLIRQPNAGPAHARNRGLSEAQGEFVTFLDADDEWLADFLSRTVQLLGDAAAEVAAVSAGYLQYPGGRSTRALWERRGLREGMVRLTSETSPGFAVSVTAYMSPWNTLLRSWVVRQFGGFCVHGKSLYGEDSFLWTKLLLNHAVLFTMEELVAYHTEASELAIHRKGPRPVEPMLLYPEDLYSVCPGELQTLLDGILATRAAKTALMLSYFGQWRQARELLERFCPATTYHLPKVAMAHAAANFLGSAVGWACRKAI